MEKKILNKLYQYLLLNVFFSNEVAVEMVLLHTEARCYEDRSNTEFNIHVNITTEISPFVETATQQQRTIV